MKARKRRRNSKGNITGHRRAMLEPSAKKQVAELRRAWRTLGHLERGDRLRVLVDAGCSTRGLAQGIGISATTVRRFLEIASLPEQVRQSVANGASAKEVLASRADERRRHRVAERFAIEKESGRFSDELAEVLIAFCKGELGGKLWMTRDELPLFLNAVARELQSADSSASRRVRISRRLDLKDQLKVVRPKYPSSDNPIEQRASWMTLFIQSRFPELAIWERALQKASRRDKELDRKDTLPYVTRSRNWIPKYIEVPNRPARNVREVMVRQGRKPKPNA